MIDVWTAFLAALIFAVHPLGSQSVAYISGRGSVLSGLFSIAGVGLMLSGQPVLAVGMVCLACLAKEDAVSHFGVLAAAGLIDSIPYWWLALIVPMAGAWVKRRNLRELLANRGDQGMTDAGFPAQLKTPVYQMTAFVETMRRLPLWILGFKLNADHKIIPRGLWSAWGGFIVLAFLLTFASFDPLWMLIFAWVFIPLLPYWLIPMPDPIMEQRLYFSLVGISLGIASVLTWTPWYVQVGILAMFCVQTFARSWYWSAPLNLWSSVLHGGGRTDRALLQVGNVYMERGDWPTARRYFEQALEEHPNLAGPRGNLACIEKLEGNLEEAIRQYQETVRRNPKCYGAWHAMGLALDQAGRLAEAEAAYRRCLGFQPTYIPALNRSGMVCARTGRIAEAEMFFRRAHQLDPQMIDYLQNLGIALEVQGRTDEAIACFQRCPQKYELTTEMLVFQKREEVPC